MDKREVASKSKHEAGVVNIRRVSFVIRERKSSGGKRRGRGREMEEESMGNKDLIQHLDHYILKAVPSNSLHPSPCCHGDKHRMQKSAYLLYHQFEFKVNICKETQVMELCKFQRI